MAEETELQKIAGSTNAIAETLDEIRGMLVGMLFSQGQFRDRDRRSAITTTCAIKQQGSVQEYYNQFNKAFNGIYLSEEFTIDLFVTGLRDEIQSVVRKFNPNTLHVAASLAGLQEQVLFARNQKQLDEKEFELKAPKHSAIEGNFAPLSLHQSNIVESSISRGEVMVDELHSMGECNYLEQYDAIPCQESTIEFQPNVFDKMPQRLKEEQLFGELPMSDYIEKEPQMLEEMPTMKSLGTQNRSCLRDAHSYILVNDFLIAGGNWDVKGAEFTIISVMLKAFSVCDDETSKLGIMVTEHNSSWRGAWFTSSFTDLGGGFKVMMRIFFLG